MDIQLKASIRAELFRCAIAGTFLTYTRFYNRIRPGDMGKFPYQEHLKKIAEEEKLLGYPDITFMVYGKDSGLPHWIGGRDASNPDAAQIDFLQKGADEVIELYCPADTENPYRSNDIEDIKRALTVGGATV